jgi:hypothetical protein
MGNVDHGSFILSLVIRVVQGHVQYTRTFLIYRRSSLLAHLETLIYVLTRKMRRIVRFIMARESQIKLPASSFRQRINLRHVKSDVIRLSIIQS